MLHTWNWKERSQGAAKIKTMKIVEVCFILSNWLYIQLQLLVSIDWEILLAVNIFASNSPELQVAAQELLLQYIVEAGYQLFGKESPHQHQEHYQQLGIFCPSVQLQPKEKIHYYGLHLVWIMTESIKRAKNSELLQCTLIDCKERNFLSRMIWMTTSKQNWTNDIVFENGE